METQRKWRGPLKYRTIVVTLFLVFTNYSSSLPLGGPDAGKQAHSSSEGMVEVNAKAQVRENLGSVTTPIGSVVRDTTTSLLVMESTPIPGGLPVSGSSGGVAAGNSNSTAIRVQPTSTAEPSTTSIAATSTQGPATPTTTPQPSNIPSQELSFTTTSLIASTTPMPATSTTPPPPPMPFVYGAISLLGPQYDNLTTTAAEKMFVDAVVNTFKVLGEPNPPTIDVFGWCRVRGDGCKLSAAYLPHAPMPVTTPMPEGAEGATRRAKVVVDGATVHFRAMGYSVNEGYARIMNRTNFLTGCMVRMTRGGYKVVRAEWNLYPVYCTGKDVAADHTCNTTRIVSSISDPWFDLEFSWGEFPTFDIMKDSFIILSALVGIVCGSIVLWVSISCQQWRMKRRKNKGKSKKKRGPNNVIEDSSYLTQLEDEDD